MKITGAIFDMDGTILDSLGFWDYIWEFFGKKYLSDPAFRPDDVTAKGVRTVSLKGAMELVYRNCNIGESAEELFKMSYVALGEFYKERAVLKEGVTEFLDELKARGVKMCIASASMAEHVEIIMNKFNLQKYFPAVISCNDIGRGKEHPDVFILAHEYLGTDKETTYVFEDSVVAIETAVKAGYKTVGVFDKFNFGIDRIKEIATYFIDENENLTKLLA